MMLLSTQQLLQGGLLQFREDNLCSYRVIDKIILLVNSIGTEFDN